MMEWADLERQATALRDDRGSTAVDLAANGALLLHRALSEMFIGEPESLRAAAWVIIQARPEVVAMRNVGVSAYRTALEARSGDRMAAAARSVLRLSRLLQATPRALARRGQSLIPDGARITTLGYSASVLATLSEAGGRIDSVAAMESTGHNGRLALELAGAGIRVETIGARDVGAALNASDIVLLGCSAFLADGSMVAEPGVLELVEAAAARDGAPVPVHFFADTLKLAPWLPAPLHGGRELEIIPAEYVDHVITEDGIRRPPQLLQAAADLTSWWHALETPAESDA